MWFLLNRIGHICLAPRATGNLRVGLLHLFRITDMFSSGHGGSEFILLYEPVARTIFDLPKGGTLLLVGFAA